jgi:hypothetical protein
LPALAQVCICQKGCIRRHAGACQMHSTDLLGEPFQTDVGAALLFLSAMPAFGVPSFAILTNFDPDERHTVVVRPMSVTRLRSITKEDRKWRL